MDDTATILGRRIRIYRASLDLTQKSLAERWKISQTALSLLENGKPCPQLSAYKIARIAKEVVS
jgi:DNA-binding XRE family transcriptional regulator